MAGRADIMAGRAYVSLYVKNSAFMRGLRQAKQQLAEFGADIQALGRQMVVASAAMLVPLAMASKTFADFDDGMRSVGAVSNATAEELEILTERAKELGRTTSFTAIEVASLMAELGRAGFKPDQVDKMTGSVLALARATGTDATISSGIMAASIRQFSLGAGDASRVADGLTAAANKSFNTVEQLGEALSYAGPVAADFNVSLEDTLAILGGLGNVGIQGSNAGTAVRRLLTLSGAEAENMKRIFGVTFRDAAGNARPLVDVLAEVNEATANLGTADRAKKFNEAFGLLGITGASAIARSTGDIRQLAEEIKAAGGVAEETAGKMDAGLGGAFRIIMSAAEGLKIAIGEAIEGPLEEIVKSGTQVLGVITKLAEENKDAIATFGKWALILGSAGAALLGIGLLASFASVVLGGLMAIVSAGAMAFGALIGIVSGLFAVMTSPITLAVVAIGGLVAALLEATGGIEYLVETGSKLFGRLSQIFDDTFSGIKDALAVGDIGLAGTIAMTGLKLAFTEGMAAVEASFHDGIAGLAEAWGGFLPGLVEAFAGAMGSISNMWRDTQTTIAKGIVELWGSMPGTDFGETQRFESMTSAEKQREQSMLQKRLSSLESGMEKNGATLPMQDRFRLQQDIDRTRASLAKLKASGSSDPVAESQDAIDQATADARQASEEYWGSLGESARNAGRSARQRADEARSSGADDIRRLEMKLADLRMQAELRREAADAEPVAGGGGADSTGGASGGGSASVGGRSSVAFFSGAAAIAAGQGGAPQQEQVKLLREANKDRKELIGIDRDLIRAVKANSLQFVA